MISHVCIKPNQTEYSILFIASLALLLLGVVFLTACQAPEAPEESAGETALAGQAISLGCTRSAVRSCRSTVGGIAGTFIYSGRRFTYRNSCTAAGQSAAKYRCVSPRLYEVCRSACELATDICKSGECCQRTSPNTPIVNVCNGNVLTNTTDTTCGPVTYSYDCSTPGPGGISQRCDPLAPDGVQVGVPGNPNYRRIPGPSCV